MKDGLPIGTVVRIGYLLLGGWLVVFGLGTGIGAGYPAVALVLHPAALLAGIAFLLCLHALPKKEVAGMITLSVFLLAMGVLPYGSVFRLSSGNLLGMILWGVSLLAGCLIPLGLGEKRWGDRFGLSLLSVWLIIWPLPVIAYEPRIGLMVGTLLPILAGSIILGSSLVLLLYRKSGLP